MLKQRWVNNALFTARCGSLLQAGFVFLLCSASVAQAEAPAVSAHDQAEVKLALGIVHKYRDLRASCRSLPDDQKGMCFYRLKIGNWDYREAKLILAKHKLI